MRSGLAVALVAVMAAPAAADSNDLVLSRLSTRMLDGTGKQIAAVGQPLEFRELSSQLGVVLAPHLLTPADTLGFSGFQFSVDYAQTTIDSGAAYWRALEGTAPAALTTVGFFARKGLWFPVPSFEIGAGAIHIVDSHLWAGNLYAKLALHEGYHDLPLPSLAVRGAVSRMMSQQELDLTVASVDVAISKHIGVGGTWRFDPFVGGDILMIVPRSEVIDTTPNVDSTAMGNAADTFNNFVFKDQSTIYRNRVFVGAKLQYYVFQLTLEAVFAFAGSSSDAQTGISTDCLPMSTTAACNAKDESAAQRTLALSAGFDF
jgi:hypothetical protein